MTVTELLNNLQDLDIDIGYDEGQLIVEAPKGALTPELRTEIKAHKAEIIALLQDADNVTEQHVPLSSAQNRFWFLHEFDKEQAVYSLSNAYRVIGPLDVPVLERSLQEIIRRHEVLRTNIVLEGGTLRQVVREGSDPVLELIDLTDGHLETREKLASELAAGHAKRSFDLAHDPMLRVQLFKIDEQEYILVITMHHIASDGWSIGIFWRELMVLYSAYIKGKVSPLPALPMQYSEYALWQQKWLKGPGMQRQLSYWQEQLAGLPVQDLPTDRPRPPVQTYDGESLWFSLPEVLLAQLRLLARRENATLYMTLLAAYTLLLQRYLRQEDIALGTVVANRSHPQAENLIGPFINTLVIRTDMSGNPTFAELLQRVRDVALDAYDNQVIPFETLLEELSPEHDLSRTPYFQTMLVLETISDEDFTPVELTVEDFSLETGGSSLDLSLYIFEDETESELSGYFEFNTDLFDRSTIERMVGHFETLLEAIVVDPNRPIADMPILTPEEEAQLDGWNRTAVDFGELADIVGQFYEQAESVPEEVAFIFDERQMTFGELNERSNRLASFIIRRGVVPGTRIGLAVERSLIVPAAILAIFKAGGVYVPLDPAYPVKRLRHIIKDSDISFFLTTRQWREKLALDAVGEKKIFCLDALEVELEKEPKEDLELRLLADDIAYIIYTSGSLGQPKGVEVALRQIMNRLAWMWKEYPVQPNEVGCQKTALNFVDSLWELLGYLLQGRPTVIISDDKMRNLKLLVETLAREKVTRLWLVPSLLRAILQTQPDLQKQLPHLTSWVCSGEALPVDLARQFEERIPDAVLYNLYGTSEVWDATWYDPQKEEAEINGLTVPIGRPIANVRNYILDEQRNRVPVGVPGELYVGGIGLGEGYINRPEETARRFLPDPFGGNGRAPVESTGDGPRMYHTGDLARWLPDGNIEFLGRVDRQMKIRGIRIEPDEIEALARKHDAVTDAVLIVYGEDNEKHLVLYVTAVEVDEELATELRDYLADWLPLTLVPSRIVILGELPLTPSSKVDRNALADIELDPIDPAGPYVAPRTENEAVLAEMWVDLLKIKRVGIYDNFFDLGGHSLLGLLLVARIEEQFGSRLPVSVLFNHPTIAQLGALLEQEGESREPGLPVPIMSGGTRPPFFCVYGFGGSVLGYVDLADQLGPEQPFYGLEARGLDGNEPPDESIETMAGHCIDTMRTVQPSGPYRIGGYCLGGVVAFEMARQLGDQGEAVALVAIIEGFSPVYYHESLPFFHPHRLLAAWKGLAFWFEDYSRLGFGQLVRKVRVKIDELRYRTQENRSEEVVAAIANTDVDQLSSHQVKLMTAQMHALRHYRGGYYEGKVILFRTEHQSISRTAFGSLDPAYGWGRLSREGVDVQIVDGAHHNLHLPPYVSSLASRLADCLEAVSAVE